ncbi:MAG: hypothetical protein Q8830_01775 [Candidatus Phytoplasma australasiaticum]|nr:hypothetical protein [Candidatus Phytoplasma australasiaticum]
MFFCLSQKNNFLSLFILRKNFIKNKDKFSFRIFCLIFKVFYYIFYKNFNHFY